MLVEKPEFNLFFMFFLFIVLYIILKLRYPIIRVFAFEVLFSSFSERTELESVTTKFKLAGSGTERVNGVNRLVTKG